MDGKVAVVTGAAGGIGGALARLLVREGASVLATDRDAAGLERVVEASGGRSSQILATAGDITDQVFIERSVSTAESLFGPVDVFFANAGIGEIAPSLEISDDEWSRSLDVNLMAHVRAARVMLPRWLERGGGYFVATASAAGLLSQIGGAPYSVSKHAAVAFAEWLSITYGDRGVRVSCLCPMGVNTAMLNEGREASSGMAAMSARAVTRSGTVMEPEEVADRVISAMKHESFLILPHPEVGEFFRRKGSDYDRWLRGMRRLQASLA